MTREEAIQRLYRMGRSHVGIIDENTLADNKALSMAIEALSEPKTGKWLLEEHKSQNHIENFYICSSCRNFEAWGETELYNYCPNCGAKMEGAE